MSIFIDNSKKEVQIRFSKAFYNEVIVKEALIEFANICKVQFKIQPQVIEVYLAPLDFNLLNLVGYEFSNYVLGLMKNKGVV